MFCGGLSELAIAYCFIFVMPKDLREGECFGLLCGCIAVTKLRERRLTLERAATGLEI
jgi:hypothetical protein